MFVCPLFRLPCLHTPPPGPAPKCAKPAQGPAPGTRFPVPTNSQNINKGLRSAFAIVPVVIGASLADSPKSPSLFRAAAFFRQRHWYRWTRHPRRGQRPPKPVA
ncbi:hypothetical protein LIA77_02072 [Sarocladium implicatum]|nr:hypothetical protein LIA77_02072 [Sarocladium implicatum]